MNKKAILFSFIGLLFFYSSVQLVSGDSGLPPVAEEKNKLSGMGSVLVKGYNLEGNTVFTNEELIENVLSKYQGREITAEELQDAKNAITLYYIDKGYVNSGAVIPDQEVKDGIILIRIIEGKLIETIIAGNSWLRTHYISSRLKSATDPGMGPLNILKLQERLKLIKQDSLVDNVNAELSPGLELGEAILKIEVEEAKPWFLRLIANNHNSPNIGAYRGEIEGGILNMTGWGDSLTASYGLTEGLDSYSINYAVPVTRWDTTIGAGFDRSESTVVSYPFKELDIRSETTSWNAFIRHPFYKTLATEFALGLKLTSSESKTFLGDEPFPFTGSEDAINKQTALRFTQEWVHRSMTQVIAVHSSFNFGMDMMDSTILDTEPDGKFISWLGQFQWIRQVPIRKWDTHVLFRCYLQIANDPVLPVEKFAIGGSSTVRGYRENHMTTDNGIVSSVEWRLPIANLQIPGISKKPSDGELLLAPFFDFGKGWNTDVEDPDPDTIYSIGLGLRWNAGDMFRAEIYWGYGLKEVDDPAEDDIQDDGIHFQVVIDFF